MSDSGTGDGVVLHGEKTQCPYCQGVLRWRAYSQLPLSAAPPRFGQPIREVMNVHVACCAGCGGVFLFEV